MRVSRRCAWLSWILSLALVAGCGGDGDGIGRSLSIVANSSLDSLAGLDALVSVGEEVSLVENPLLSDEEIQVFLDRLGF